MLLSGCTLVGHVVEIGGPLGVGWTTAVRGVDADGPWGGLPWVQLTWVAGSAGAALVG